MVEYRHLLGIGTADNEYDINSYPQLLPCRLLLSAWHEFVSNRLDVLR